MPQFPVRFTRVGYAYLPTTRLQESIDWYVRHLGLRLISQFEDRGSQIAVLHYPHRQAIAVLLVETTDVSPLALRRNGNDYPVLALNCPDIEATYHALREEGVHIVHELTALGAGEAKYFYFRDNEGNLLEGAWSKWDPEDEIKPEFMQG